MWYMVQNRFLSVYPNEMLLYNFVLLKSPEDTAHFFANLPVRVHSSFPVRKLGHRWAKPSPHFLHFSLIAYIFQVPLSDFCMSQSVTNATMFCLWCRETEVCYLSAVLTRLLGCAVSHSAAVGYHPHKGFSFNSVSSLWTATQITSPKLFKLRSFWIQM